MSEVLPLALVVAVADNGVIGRDGDLPWRMSDDLKWFRKVTMGKPVIMGRTTYESIGRPLPGRTNIVLSRGGFDAPSGVALATSLTDARELTRDIEAEEACIIGGAALYAEALPLADRLYVTRVRGNVEGDRLFELPPLSRWQAEIVGEIAEGPGNDYPATIERWTRTAPSPATTASLETDDDQDHD